MNPDEEIVFANELHIPTGEPINIRLESVDVIHSFWVPKIGGKVDMVHGNGNDMWLQADTPGYLYAQCAEFCGVAHALMLALLHISEPTRHLYISYAVFCLKKKKKNTYRN